MMIQVILNKSAHFVENKTAVKEKVSSLCQR